MALLYANNEPRFPGNSLSPNWKRELSWRWRK